MTEKRDYIEEFKGLTPEQLEIFPKKLKIFDKISDTEKAKIFAFYQTATKKIHVKILAGNHMTFNPFVGMKGQEVDPDRYYGEYTESRFTQKVMEYLNSLD